MSARSTIVLAFASFKSTIHRIIALNFSHCTAMSPSTKTFAYDERVLDPAIVSHIASLYGAVDSGEHEFWGSHFTEDAELKKGTTNVKGRSSTLIGIPVSFLTNGLRVADPRSFKHSSRRSHHQVMGAAQEP